ncbi:MAG: ATP-binding protein [Bacteroidales bacterium]|nr:ATP-binding protein [Bacteroidales bacterium]
MPIKGYSYSYNEDTDTSFIVGKTFQINLLESSSGFQSLVPLYLVSRRISSIDFNDEDYQRKNLNVTQSIRMNTEISDLMLNNKIGIHDKNEEIDKIRARYFNKCFINIVEEPELNLYPSSQWEILKSLMEYNNTEESNKLLMTTHSPYIINFLTLAVKANSLYSNINNESKKSKLEEIVPFSSTVDSKDLAIYEFDDKGNINKLGDYNGLPSDDNFLNNMLAEGNNQFGALLDIEEQL